MSVVGYCSVTKSCPTLCEPMDYCTPVPSIISCSLLKFISIETGMLPYQLILCPHRLLLPSIVPSIRVISNELALRIRRAKYWCIRSSISLSSEYSGLISFSTDWFDLLETLKRLLQNNLKVSILQHSTFFYGPIITSI